jgi:hypothetical protein
MEPTRASRVRWRCALSLSNRLLAISVRDAVTLSLQFVPDGVRRRRAIILIQHSCGRVESTRPLVGETGGSKVGHKTQDTLSRMKRED